MENMSFPAVATLKGECPQGETLTQLLGQMFADKGIGLEPVRYLSSQPSHFIGTLIGHLVMHFPHYSRVARRLQQCLPTTALPLPQYRGSRQENGKVDAAIFHSDLERGGMRSTTWKGASGAYFGGGITIPRPMQEIRVLVIGAGASGILAARALSNAGFQHILLMDQSGETCGVWGKDNLKDAPMAVPFPLRFEQFQLEAAPRPGSEVTRFLEQLVSPPVQSRMRPLPGVMKAQVLRIVPGDLAHQVIYLDDRGEERELTAPIIVNAVGVGEPLHPSRPGTMTTDILPESAGGRWQEVWTEEQARFYHGRTVCFISLSNSTLEMLKRIQWFNRHGLDIGYQVLTHYPLSALANPLARVEHRGGSFRLYRDPARYELLRVAGDLPDVASAFEDARDSNHIVPHVSHWTLEHGEQRQLMAVLEDGEKRRVACDALYTLIGYGPRAEVLQHMGLSVNHPYLGAVDQDYDGEAQRAPGSTGRSRVWPGYFCLGLRNAYNPNEVLLPGLLYRLPNLVAGVIFRAAECVLRNQV